MTEYNKIITTANSVTPHFDFLPSQDDIIIIDTSFARIGINTFTPDESIHISGGTIKSDRGIFNDISIGAFISHIVPSDDASLNLGSSSKKWAYAYLDNIDSDICFNKTVYLWRNRETGNRDAKIKSSNKLIIQPENILGGANGRVIIDGDLEVKGTQTTVNSTEVDISDNVITLDARYNATIDNGLGGIAVRTNFTSDNDSIKKFVWNNITKSWTTKGEQFDCSFITIRDISISSTFDTSLNLYSSEILHLKAYNKIQLNPGMVGSNDQKIINISGNIHNNNIDDMTFDTNQSIINNLAIGFTGSDGTTMPGIGNKTAMGNSDGCLYKYALKQDNNGSTYINAAYGEFIRFRNNNNTSNKISIGKDTGNDCILFEDSAIVKFKCSTDDIPIIKSESASSSLIVEISHQELGYLDGTFPTTVVPNKAVVYGSTGDICANNIELKGTANFKVPETQNDGITAGWGGLEATITGTNPNNALHLANVSASSHGTAIVNNTILSGTFTINNLTSDSTLRNNSEFAILFKIQDNGSEVKFIGYENLIEGGGINNAKVNNPNDIRVGGGGDALVTILCINGTNYLSVSKYV